jgi:hypothetical protein
MKTIKLIITTVIIAVFSVMLPAQNNDRVIFTSTEITVKQGHHEQFIEGVKKWKECYLENKGERKWRMWRRVQGEGNVYVLTRTMANWAEMDKDDPEGKKCQATLLNYITPHVEKVNYSISQTMPELSRTWPEDAKHAWVTYYKVKNSFAFKEVITAVTGAIKDKEGSFRGIWREYKGGSTDAPDYMIATPYKKFADLDISRDQPAKIYTDAVGEEKASEMWDKWFDTVLDSWSYIFTLNTELSN